MKPTCRYAGANLIEHLAHRLILVPPGDVQTSTAGMALCWWAIDPHTGRHLSPLAVGPTLVGCSSHAVGVPGERACRIREMFHLLLFCSDTLLPGGYLAWNSVCRDAIAALVISPINEHGIEACGTCVYISVSVVVRYPVHSFFMAPVTEVQCNHC